MSGFIGKAMERHLSQRGDRVVGLSIRETTPLPDIVAAFEDADAVINLSGATILRRWSRTYKKMLTQSRLNTTQKIVEAISKCATPPSVLLNASAIGIYDSFHQHDETSRDLGEDFLSGLVRAWEYCAAGAASENTRVCMMRFGVVYAKEGGAMEKMLPAFRMGLGGKLGDGFQMVSWIHLDDLVRACTFLLEHEEMAGVVNLTAPEPICNLRQTQMMGSVLKRPTFLSLPAWALQLAFGEGAGVMLDSKEVYPRRLQEAGFEFFYPTFYEAMEQIGLES